MPGRLLRRMVAFVGHVPGLWLVYRDPLPRRLLALNAIAILVTVALMGAGYLAAPRRRVLGVLLGWMIGHMAWGAYLARHVDAPGRVG